MIHFRRVKISEMCSEIIDCVNKTAPSESESTPYKMVRTPNVGKGFVTLGDAKSVSKEVFDKWSRGGRQLKNNDIVLTREAPLGNVGMFCGNELAFLGQRTVLYRVDKKRYDPYFVLAAFLSSDVQAQIHAFGSGATVAHMRVPDAKEIEIDTPSLEIQKKIGTFTSTLLNLISNNCKRIYLLEKTAQLLYKEWFVSFKFPGNEKLKMIHSDNSKVGAIPEGWSILKFSEAVQLNPNLKIGKNVSSPYFGMECLSTDSMIISPDNENRSTTAGSKFQSRDVLFARITPCLENGKTGYVLGLKPNVIGLGSTEFVVMREKLLKSELIYFIARDAHFRSSAKGAMVGASGRQRVAPEFFSEYEIIVPDAYLQDQFVEIVKPIFELCYNLSNTNRALAKMRDLILPKLISGDIDISELNDIALDSFHKKIDKDASERNRL